MEEKHKLIQVRQEKLEEIQKMGVNPYPYSFKVNGRAREMVAGFMDTGKPEEGPVYSIAGRIMSLRGKGKVTFAHIDDGGGRIQIYVRQEDVGQKTYDLVNLLDLGDIIGVEGYLFRTHTGEITICVKKLTLLAKSIRQLPIVKEKVVGDHKEVYDKVEDKELRYRQRYVDLIVNPEVKDVFRARARIMNSVRAFLDSKGFLEVDTPVLQPIYGGAAARPFTTHHHALDSRLFLRISNELYLKRLVVGGLNRVYEFSRDFRNEGLDRSHNPEFTMLEFYQAYVDYYEIMDMVEEMISFVAAEVLGEKGKEIEWQGKRINLAGPWPRRAIIDLLGEKIGARISVPLDREQLVQICRRLGLETDSRMGSGKILDKLFGELVEHELTNPTMVMDYPLETSPLAKRHRDNPDLVERFELIIGGMEIANAFSELNDPLDQRKRFEAQMRLRDLGDEEAQVLDEDYLRAMEYGLPPTGGVGIGIDRLTMLLTGQESIKDVILFPTLRPEEAK